MVHQHFMLIPAMTVAENIVLGEEPTQRRRAARLRRGARRAVRELSERFGSPSTRRAVEDITVGQQQRVEILKALYRGAEILILDEPTAVLTPQEATSCSRSCASSRREGKSVVFITHKLSEVLAMADRITVLRRGKTSTRCRREGATEASLARMMVGREVLLRVEKTPATARRRRARASRASHVVDDRGLDAVRGVSSRCARGEILGIAGVDGNGQTRADRGADRAARIRRRAGSRVGGADVTRRDARANCSTRAWGTSPRTVTARAGARVPARREPRAARLRHGPDSRLGLDHRDAVRRRARAAAAGVRRARRGAARPAGAPPAATSRRSSSRARSRETQAADRGAADPRPRRRRDRVHAPAPRRAARRRRGGPPRLARARRDRCRSPTGSS